MLIGILLSVAGFVCIIITMILQVKSIAKFDTIRCDYIKVTGKMIGFRRSGNSSSKGVYPDIEFETNDGQILVHHSKYSTSQLQYRRTIKKCKGEAEIYYNPSEPKEAIYYKAIHQYLPVIIGLPFGIVWSIFGLAICFGG